MQLPIDNFIAPPCRDEISILFQDEHLLLINKPSGLLSLSGKNPLNKDSVHFRLTQYFPAATLVHRLDFGTSGIMVVALNKHINSHISHQFQTGSVHKTYTAILDGHIMEESGVIDAPIAKDVNNFPLQKICFLTGKKSLTKYKIIDRLERPARTRVLFLPVTGRTHQLRIHSQYYGHSILGCDLYASEVVGAMAPRLMLHATSIAFVHPMSNTTMHINCICPF